MAAIGNRSSAMRLQCKHCQWAPPESMQMEGVLLHFQVEHDTDQVHFDLVAVCTCGAAMTVTNSRPTGGGIKDYLSCGACGNTGSLVRKEGA